MAEVICVSNGSGGCIHVPVPEGNGSAAPVGQDIVASVGLNATNREDDVRVVQTLLNRIPPQEGGAEPQLDVDGKCGLMTRQAIAAFQFKQFGWKDSRVDPAKQTIAKLKEVAARYPDDLTNPYLTPLLFANVPVAYRWVRTARRQLALARAHLAAGRKPDKSDGGRALALANLYFHVDQQSARRAVESIGFADRIYSHMEDILKSGSPGHDPETGFIKVAPPGKTYEVLPGLRPLGFAVPGGYWMRKADGTGPILHHADLGFRPIRKDAAYFYPDRIAKHKPEMFPRLLLHELAHFTGGQVTSADLIDDHSYYLLANFPTLSPYWAVRTAESYPHFAGHAATGEPIKPHILPKVGTA